MKSNIIDVSKWQGNIDWQKAKADGVDTVFFKATQGVGYTDPRVAVESKEASALGIKLGYYHFASLNDHDEVKDATEEAKYFISVVKTLPKATMPLVLDIEENKGGLSKEEVLAWIKAFFMELQVLGYNDFMLYSYTPFLNSNLPANHGLGGIKLWLAAYTNAPKMPNGWVDSWLWQYSSKGEINGITGNVDLNKN